MIIETGTPRLRSQDCTGSTEECFVCDDPRSYVWAESGQLYCLAEVPDRPSTLTALLFGSLLLGAGIALSRRNITYLSGLGDEAASPAPVPSFDPSRSNRDAYIRTHTAKKFWGTSVLMSQGAESMRKLALRIRKSDTKTADDATRLSVYLDKVATESLEVAKEKDPVWVQHHMRRIGRSTK